jgi:hypothetical protein
MPLASITFLSPEAGLVALAVALPLAALVLADRRLASARAILRLAAPAARGRTPTVAALAAVPLLLGLAAAQPAVRKLQGASVRTDAEAMFVLDISRSMAASAGPGRPNRLARARGAAVRLRSGIENVPSGVATLTDRALPDLFPLGDVATFDSTVEHVEIEQPPPQNVNVTATTFAPLADVATHGYFSPRSTRRLIVLLTDGESRAFSTAGVARALDAGPGASLVAVRIGSESERVFGPNGRPEAYRPNPESATILAGLAAAAGGRVFPVGDVSGAERALRSALGTGPTAGRRRESRTTPLAPYVAGAALFPLLFVLRRRNL